MQRTKRRWLVWLISFAALSLLIVGCGTEESEKEQPEDQAGQGVQAPEPLDTNSDKVIAAYDGLTSGEVTEGEFNRSLNILSVVNPQASMLMAQPEFKDQLLTQYIAQKSISPEVETTDEIKDQANGLVDIVKQQYEQSQQKDKDFASFIEEQGFSEKDLHAFFEENIKVDQHFREKITDKELQSGYDELKKDKDVRLYTAKIRHILVQVNEERDDAAAKKRAEEVKTKLDDGGDFAKLAKEYSDDGSKENGGLLGEELQPLSGYVPSFAEAARDLPLNEVSDPVKSQFGYHIIEVLEREQLSFEKAKDIVQEDVFGKKYQNYVDNDLKIDTKKS